MASNCCGANIIENTDICSECLEHCSEEEYNAEIETMKMLDAQDVKEEYERE